MTPLELYKFIRNWILSVMDPVPTVIQAYGDAPAPAGQYLAVDTDTGWAPTGQRTENATDGTSRVVVTDYEVTVVAWVIKDVGAGILQDLVEKIQMFEARLHFQEANLPILRVGKISKVPVLVDKARWIIQHRVEIIFALSRGTTENVPSIGAVSIEGELDGNIVDIEVITE
jgi:hypothetical protein